VTRTRETVQGESWGDGAGWLLDRLGRVSGLEDDPSAFTTDHPVVAKVQRENPGLRLGRTDLVFDALVVAVTAQKVTGPEAASGMRGLYRRFADPAPGPDSTLKLPPDPARMAQAPYWEYHSLHIEKGRADLLRRLAADCSRIDRLGVVGSDEAATVLRAYPGVGEWTLAETLSRSHGDPDRPAVGDFHLKHMVVYHLTGRPRGTDQEMLDLLEEFRPHRGRVARLLHTLGHEPKFGPRMAPRQITRM